MVNRISNAGVMARKLCEALNIPFVAIRDIQFTVRYDDVPTLTIEKLITDDERDEITTIFNEYELIPKPIKKEKI